MKKKMFKKTIDINPDAAKVIHKLSTTAEFTAFLDLCEQYLQTRAFDLLALQEQEKGEASDELMDVRGAYHFYQEIVGLIKKINEKGPE